MGFEDTPRRFRKGWNQAPPVSVREALLNSVSNLSVVSEASANEEDELKHTRRTPSIAWELPVEDFRPHKPEKKIVSDIGHKKPKAKKNKRNLGNEERVVGIKTRQRYPKEKKKTGLTAPKLEVKKFLSTCRARQKVLKTRSDDIHKTVRLLGAECSVFKRHPSPEPGVTEEEAVITEVQQRAYDRWTKAVAHAKQALQEVVEAEKVLGFAAEFDQLKDMMDSRENCWDVGIDKYIDLYKNLQTEYPETTPIRRSRISRRPDDKRSTHSSKRRTPNENHRRQLSWSSSHSRQSSSGGESTATEVSSPQSAIPMSESSSQKFDANHMLVLGRRFAHSAEMWFLKLIHNIVGIEVSHSVYCREDCYRLMEGLSKLQNWLMNTKATTRMDRHEVLRTRLRDTIIKWSGQMFELPLARTNT